MTAPAVRVFAPASVSNVGCGFDVLGFAIEGPGDIVTVRRARAPGVEITRIDGDGGRLPLDPERNTAARAAAAALAHLGEAAGVRLEIEKRMPLSSGLGSSAASAVAAALATSELFDAKCSATELLRFALEGESFASGSYHADNVAPSLLGGFVLVRSLGPEPDIVPLPVPAGLACALARPHLEIETAGARARLPNLLPLSTAVAQWGNVGALVAALYRGDLELLGRALCDRVAEPLRKGAVPGFDRALLAARDAGALGGSLSGSGPTLFALCADRATAERAAAAMAAVIEDEAGVGCDALVSAVGARGAHRL